jgi:hypothetical protein
VLALSSDQTWWNERQLKALHHMGVADEVPAADLAIFLNQCQRTGLDPFARQIYLIGRFVKDGDRWVTKYTIQTGVDGYRVIGDRAAENRGDVIEHADPLWAGDDGVWLDLWLSDEPPAAAKYTIVKNGRRNVATVMYREFVQTRKDGAPNAMWARMPANQLAKCFSADTEILTVNGYKRFDQTGPADLIMQVTDAGLIPVAAAPFMQSYDGPMIVMHGDMLDFAVTPNHDMVTDHGKIEAAALHALATAKSAVRVPLIASGTPTDRAGVPDDDLRLLGCVIADGNETPSGYRIAVSRQYKIDQLDRLHPRKVTVQRSRGREAVTSTRVIPTNFDKLVYRFDAARLARWLTADRTVNTAALHTLSRRQARIVIDAWQLFDGHTDGRSGMRRLFTSREDHVHAAELLATLGGYSVNVPRKRTSDISDRPGYVLTLTEQTSIPITRRSGNRPQITVEEQNASGEVWCVTVPSGRIMVRRAGFGMVCGNCAEVQAWRKVYPNDFAGLMLEGAAQLDVEHNEPKPRSRAAEILGEEPTKPKSPRRAKTRRDKLCDTMFAILDDTELAGDEKRDDRLVVTGTIAGREISSTNDLDDDQLAAVVDVLRGAQQRGELENRITDILNAHALAQEDRDAE